MYGYAAVGGETPPGQPAMRQRSGAGIVCRPSLCKPLRPLIQLRGEIDQAGGEDGVAGAEAEGLFLVGLDGDGVVIDFDGDVVDLRQSELGAFLFFDDQPAVGDEQHPSVERRLVDAVLLKAEGDRALRARQSGGDGAQAAELFYAITFNGDVVIGDAESFAQHDKLRLLRFAGTIVRQEVPDDGGVEVAFGAGDVVRGQAGCLAGGAEQAGDSARFGDASAGQLFES